jgi:hypothetical protein
VWEETEAERQKAEVSGVVEWRTGGWTSLVAQDAVVMLCIGGIPLLGKDIYGMPETGS